MWRQICVVALLISAVCAIKLHREDRRPRSADTLWITSRYGRSMREPTENNIRNNNRVVRHAEEEEDQQKNNRFFMTNRYGKRAGQVSERLAKQLNDRFGDRWKREIICDCMPREHYKRRAFRIAA